ncbi:MAG TPA: transporter [Allosphingosinicella sp.]|jgi:hypothetical protein
MRFFACAAGLAACLAATPAAAEDLREFCPDRPGLGTPACTMDRGHAAVELGLFDWTLERSGGDRTDTFQAGDLLVRYGVTDSLEVQLGWTAFGAVRDRAGGMVDKASGVGDLLVALRQNLRNPDGSGFSAAIMPYATLPAGGAAIGAGDWGAGLILPVSYELPGGFALGFTGSVDAAVDEDRHGRHMSFGGVAGLDIPLGEAAGATVELAAVRDRDPAGSSTQFLAGLSGALMVGSELQLDAGANVGLNRSAPDVELYFGLARRF